MEIRQPPSLHARDHLPGGPDGLNPRFVPVVFDGGGSVLNTGVWGDVPIHIDTFDGYFMRWRLVSIDTGDLQVDIWKSDYASFPPTVADSITGSDPPVLSGSDKGESLALIGWTTLVQNGDVLRFNIDSVSGITKATLTLTIAA